MIPTITLIKTDYFFFTSKSDINELAKVLVECGATGLELDIPDDNILPKIRTIV